MGRGGCSRRPRGADRIGVDLRLQRWGGAGPEQRRQCTKSATCPNVFVPEGWGFEGYRRVQPDLAVDVLRGQARDGPQPGKRVEKAEDARAWLRGEGACFALEHGRSTNFFFLLGHAGGVLSDFSVGCALSLSSAALWVSCLLRLVM